MTTLREAAQMALEALESSRVFVTTREKIKHPEGTQWYDERIEALRTALAAKEPEWQGLTEDEVAQAWAKSKGDVLYRLKPFAQAIKAKLKAKNAL